MLQKASWCILPGQHEVRECCFSQGGMLRNILYPLQNKKKREREEEEWKRRKEMKEGGKEGRKIKEKYIYCRFLTFIQMSWISVHGSNTSRRQRLSVTTRFGGVFCAKSWCRNYTQITINLPAHSSSYLWNILFISECRGGI